MTTEATIQAATDKFLADVGPDMVSDMDETSHLICADRQRAAEKWWEYTAKFREIARDQSARLQDQSGHAARVAELERQRDAIDSQIDALQAVKNRRRGARFADAIVELVQ